MAEHSNVVPTVRPTRRQQAVELGKDMLILLLSISAVFLAARTPMLTQLRGWMSEPTESVQPELRHSSEAATPYLVAVRNERGLYAAAYDAQQVGEAWTQVSELLGKAMSGVHQSMSIGPERWHALMESSGIYCAFQGRVPLETLAVWLGADTAPVGEIRDLLLAWSGGEAWLAWRDGERAHAASVQLSWNREMSPVLREFSPNGAAFAYTLAESDPLYKELEPYVLVQMNPPQPLIYTGSSPDLVGNRDTLKQFLNVMGFETGGGTAYETPEGLAISEGGDRLRVSRSGHVLYHAGEESRYSVPSQGEHPTREEAALAAWELANRAVSGWKGEGSYVLTGVEPAEDGWLVTFHFQVNGTPVMMADTGWAAQFTTEGRSITDFTIHLRTYVARDTTTVVPRERLAAAALPDLNSEGGRLMLCYLDNHTDTVQAGWVAELP